MTEPDVRKGMPAVKLDRAEFEKRYRSRFVDPAFRPLSRELDAIVGAAWDAYSNSRKSPETREAGPGFVDPDGTSDLLRPCANNLSFHATVAMPGIMAVAKMQ